MFRIPVRPDLELRLIVYSHAELLFEAVQRDRAYLARWLPWVDDAQSVEVMTDWIRKGLDQFARNEGWHALLWHGDGIAGAVGFKPVDHANKIAEIGYWLAERYQGRGLITAAARAAMNYAFEEWRLNRIEIRCSAANERSAAVARRLGFEEEGLFRQAFRIRDEFHDQRLFGMLSERWLSQARS